MVKYVYYTLGFSFLKLFIFAEPETGMWGIYKLDFSKIQTIQKIIREDPSLTRSSRLFEQMINEARRPDDEVIKKNIFLNF